MQYGWPMFLEKYNQIMGSKRLIPQLSLQSSLSFTTECEDRIPYIFSLWGMFYKCVVETHLLAMPGSGFMHNLVAKSGKQLKQM